MTRIALVVHSLGQGGTDRVAVHLANGFAERHETALVTVAPGGGGSGALRDRISKAVKRHVLGSRRRGRALDFLLGFPAWLGWLRRERPDVVLATGNNVSWFTAAGFRLRGYRHGRLFIKTTNPILRPHDSPFVRFVRRRVYGRVFRLASGVLALSEAERRRLIADFPAAADRFRVVRNPYVTPEMLAVGLAPTEPASGRTVLAIGRLHHQKDFGLLLRAWARADRGGARLVIVGDGPDREALMAQAEETGIAASVTFAGYQADIVPWLAEADLFVLSSRYEGLPAVLLEAMAFNCPVISTDCFDAAREMLEGVPGCTLVPVGDEAALAAAISTPPARTPALRSVAEDYAIDAAIASHCSAMGLS